MIHAFEPDPVTNRQEPWRFYDFVSLHPEALHMVTRVKSPWGIPASYRQMEGSSMNTYELIDAQGKAVLCKFSFEPKLGVMNITSEQAAEIQARDVGHATRDLHEAIEKGEYPEWEMCVQIMADGDHPELDFDLLDDTKRWPEDKFPMLPVGRLVLDKNPANVFAETEQSAFETGVLVDGIDFSDDKMLQGRTLSYSDTQRYRVGPNHLQLPVNAPARPATTNQRDGQMAHISSCAWCGTSGTVTRITARASPKARASISKRRRHCDRSKANRPAKIATGPLTPMAIAKTRALRPMSQSGHAGVLSSRPGRERR